LSSAASSLETSVSSAALPSRMRKTRAWRVSSCFPLRAPVER